MKVTWLARGVQPAPDGSQTSGLASTRYRALLPARAMRGADAEVIDLHHADEDANRSRLAESDVVVLQKLTANRDGYGEAADVYRRVLAWLRPEARLVLDINDDHFDDASFAGFYRGIAWRADAWVVSTHFMARRLRGVLGVAAAVVPDVVEGAEMHARSPVRRLQAWLLERLDRISKSAEANARLQLLWYGHQSNLPALAGAMDELAAASVRQPIDLLCVTGDVERLRAVVSAWNAAHGPGLRVSLMPWSFEALREALAACDMVVIPAELERHGVLSKSPNRLLESIAAGRIAICHPTPSFLEFQRHAWIGERLDEGIRWALEHPREALARVREGQRYIARFQPGAIAERWLEVLRAVPRRSAPEVSAGGGPLKLNLGCGDKHLAGYVNVDAVARPGAPAPDVLCDVRDLRPFASASADEILAVHVLEHFAAWEAEPVLAEWIRVLKPGGRLVIECPDLAHACRQIGADPRLAARHWSEATDLMWVIYGDPRWRDALMSHRWGYSPESLAELMRRCGLERVAREPAQFKRREPRDMRVVGYRPDASRSESAAATRESGALQSPAFS